MTTENDVMVLRWWDDDPISLMNCFCLFSYCMRVRLLPFPFLFHILCPTLHEFAWLHNIYSWRVSFTISCLAFCACIAPSLACDFNALSSLILIWYVACSLSTCLVMSYELCISMGGRRSIEHHSRYGHGDIGVSWVCLFISALLV